VTANVYGLRLLDQPRVRLVVVVMALAVVPLLIGLGAGVSPLWIASAYLLLSASQPIGAGEFSWLLRRGFPTAGALTLLIGLLRVRRTPAHAEVVSAGDGTVTAPGSG
jgi:hypothetical protein